LVREVLVPLYTPAARLHWHFMLGAGGSVFAGQTPQGRVTSIMRGSEKTVKQGIVPEIRDI